MAGLENGHMCKNLTHTHTHTHTHIHTHMRAHTEKVNSRDIAGNATEEEDCFAVDLYDT